MSFLNPIGLLGLLSLPIILALHALRARNERVVVSSLALWRFLEPEKHGRRARSIPLTWVLILQLLVAALLSIALSQPSLTKAEVQRVSRHIILIFDVSASMGAEDVLPNRLAVALGDVPALLDDLGPEDIVTVLTFGGQSKTLFDTRQTNLQSEILDLNSLIPGSTGSDLIAALALANAVHDPTLPAQVHIFTDAAYAEPNLAGFGLPVVWHVYSSADSNQAVLDLSILSLSRDKHQVYARIANFGSQLASRNVTIFVDDEMVTTAQVSLPPDASQTVTWDIAGRPEAVVVQLDGTDIHPLDDRAVIALSERETQRVALVAEDPAPLDRALEAVDGVDLDVLAPDEYLPGSEYALVVFRGVLPERWPGGNVLVFDPPITTDLLPIGAPVDIISRPIAQPDPILKDADFSGVRWGTAYTLLENLDGFSTILSADGVPLLLRGRVGLAQITLMLPDLDSGNLTRHPAFPVMIANAVQLSGGSLYPATIAAGTQLDLPQGDEYERIRIISPDNNVVEYASNRPLHYDQTHVAGLYRIELVDSLDGQTTSHAVGIHAGSREESAIAAQFSPASQTLPEGRLQTMETSISLVPYFLAAVLVLLLLEAWAAWARKN